MKVSMVQESSMHASLQISDTEYHNFLKKNNRSILVLITNCVLTFSKCVFLTHGSSVNICPKNEVLVKILKNVFAV